MSAEADAKPPISPSPAPSPALEAPAPIHVPVCPLCGSGETHAVGSRPWCSNCNMPF